MLDNNFGSCCVRKDIAERIVLASKNSVQMTHSWGGRSNGSVPVSEVVCKAVPEEAQCRLRDREKDGVITRVLFALIWLHEVVHR